MSEASLPAVDAGHDQAAHTRVTPFSKRAWIAALIPVLWCAASLPLPYLKWPIFLLFALIVVVSPICAALTLITSSFFYATMVIPADMLYMLRALAILSSCVWWVLVQRANLPAHVLAWISGAAALLAMGSMITIATVGEPNATSRSVVLESAVSLLWIMGILVGWGFATSRGGRLLRIDVVIIALAWIVGIGYGVAQTIFGIGPSTVPPDVLPYIEGIQQYEELGRRPFAFLTANGMGVVSFFPIVLLLAFLRRNSMGVVAAMGLGVVVGLLSLTRSYLALLVLLVVLMTPALRVSRRAWAAQALVLLLAALAFAWYVDIDFVLNALRLEDDASSMRAEIWTFTLQQMNPWHWIVGMGFGSGVWLEFLAPLGGEKDLASPHMALLEVTGQLGIAGLLAYCTAGWVLLRTYLALRDQPELGAPALAGLLILLREQVAASYVFSPSMLAAAFWVIFGITLGIRDAKRTGQQLIAAGASRETDRSC